MSHWIKLRESEADYELSSSEKYAVLYLVIVQVNDREDF